jgi:DNA-binding transcriptional MerR regulator
MKNAVRKLYFCFHVQFSDLRGFVVMRIKEVEDLLGIDRETIRFYIKEGLVTPKQDPNGYRDYSDEDVRQLKRIIVMRDLEMSVADIRGVCDGEVEIASALRDSEEALNRKHAVVTNAIRACGELMKSNSASFDPERYFIRRG